MAAMIELATPLTLSHGPTWANRIALAPLTNWQSHADGTLGEDEYRWLTMRAAGGFGLTMTCAAHVQASGQGFPGQLGAWSDAHLPGLARLAAGSTPQQPGVAHRGIPTPRALSVGRLPRSGSGAGGGDRTIRTSRSLPKSTLGSTSTS